VVGLNADASKDDGGGQTCTVPPDASQPRPPVGPSRQTPRTRSREQAWITVVRGDITRQDIEAVVTAANTELRGGRGVDGAVQAAAGPRLLQASLALAPCPPGGAVLTEAFDLAPVRWVIHAVGPIYQGPQDAVTLASAYTQSLAQADGGRGHVGGLPLHAHRLGDNIRDSV